MKLTYVETNGYMLVVAEEGDDVRCFVHDDPNRICYMRGTEQAAAAMAYLSEIDPYCFDDWDSETADGEPFTVETLTDGCNVLAELVVD